MILMISKIAIKEKEIQKESEKMLMAMCQEFYENRKVDFSKYLMPNISHRNIMEEDIGVFLSELVRYELIECEYNNKTRECWLGFHIYEDCPEGNPHVALKFKPIDATWKIDEVSLLYKYYC